MRLTYIMVAIIAAAALVAGCGGDSEAERQQAAEEAVHARLVEQGLFDKDAVDISFDACMRNAMELAQERAGSTPGESGDRTRAWVQRYTAEGERLMNECRALLSEEDRKAGGGFGSSPFTDRLSDPTGNPSSGQ